MKESDKGGAQGGPPPSQPQATASQAAREGGIAGVGLSPKQSTIWEPPPRHRPPRIRASHTHTPREEGLRPLEKERSGKDPARVTQYLSLRAAGVDADDRVGGEGIRWARVLAGSGGPGPRRRPARRLLPPLARLRSPLRRGYLWPSRLARRPLGPPPRPPALRGWGAAPQRPVRARRPGSRWGPPALPPASLCSQLPAPPPRLRRLPERPPYQEGESQNMQLDEVFRA